MNESITTEVEAEIEGAAAAPEPELLEQEGVAEEVEIEVKEPRVVPKPKLKPRKPIPEFQTSRLVIARDNIHYYLANLTFMNDGSFKSTLPRHSSQTAVIFKSTIDYNSRKVTQGKLIEIPTWGIKGQKARFVHHQDGTIEIYSKFINTQVYDGNLENIRSMSFPLNSKTVVEYPACIYEIQNLTDITTTDKLDPDDIVLNWTDYEPTNKGDSIAIEVYYLDPSWRFFISADHNEKQIIRINYEQDDCWLTGALDSLYPGRIFHLKSPVKTRGLLGFELYQCDVDLPEHGYSFTAAPSNFRTQKQHELADVIFAIHPKPSKMVTQCFRRFFPTEIYESFSNYDVSYQMPEASKPENQIVKANKPENQIQKQTS